MEPALQPVHEASSRSEQAYLLVKSAILSLRLKPGEPLVETRLARQLHISTTPLREALARLKREGLVVGTPFKGAIVAPVTLENACEILEIRKALEADTVTSARQRLAEDELAALRELLTRQRAALQAGDLDGCSALGKQFHLLLLRPTHNRHLQTIFENLDDHFHRIRLLSGRIPSRLQESLEQHAAILDAVEADEGVCAAQLVRQHLDSVYRDLAANWSSSTTEAAVAEPVAVHPVESAT
jgi:DNA-binding GntR family transcriptional regulator